MAKRCQIAFTLAQELDRQGCTLSPSLFSLFIEDLVECLPCGIEYDGKAIKALMFADDIVILAYSPESLQLMINRLCDYCKIWNLTVNLEKSKVMTFRKGGGRNRNSEKWWYNGETIEVVNEYRYLGILMTKNLDMENHFKDKLAKAKTAIAATWNRCFSKKNIRHSAKFRVFEAVSEAIMLYSAQVWGYKQYETVDKLLRYYIKRIFHIPSNAPNYLVMLETGPPPLFIRTLKLHIDYILKAFNMPNDRLPKIVALHIMRRNTGWMEEWQELRSQWCGMQLNLNYDNLSEWKPRLNELIANVDRKCREVYVMEATGSVHRTNYFRDEYSVDEISMMGRLRVELLCLNYMPHRDDLPIICDLCNMQERKDTLHFIGRCPVLAETRRYYLGANILSVIQIIDLLNEMNVPKLFMYCKLR
ncbi:uncharacterized protein LOC129945055 [Eupeodes corollae]|uniref:uncharacterized protein LOC129945055 n=1 Tax=Eupeodes corollae TaxID=290404 RepID=UPI00249068C4|nr:uncharacterized protein LOC129945055 [Eupeodes corollae]